MPDNKLEREDRSRYDLIDAGVDGATASVGALLAAVLPPELAIAGAALPAALKLVTELTIRRLLRFRHHVEEEGYDADVLVEGCEDSPEKAQLVIETIDATRSSATDQQLKVLAQAFVRAATSDEPLIVGFETTLIRTVGELGVAHVRVLELFTRTDYQLFGMTFPSGAAVDRQVLQLTRLHLVQHLGDSADQVIDGFVAELVARGLLTSSPIGMGGTGSAWSMTPFGAEVASRLKLVGQQPGL